ncbi:MAG TPA: histone deacetylase [Thermoanaerobaculia bacterium]|jgi:acetoin utilization deacetylase AcuC-like enzyme
MTVHVFAHEACLGHEMTPGHPERPARLTAIREELADPGVAAGLVWHQAPEASRAELERVHPAFYVDHIRDLSAAGGGVLDPDTSTNSRSWAAALRAAGAGVRAVAAALDGEGNAFLAVRPPGHHALASHAMGFCLFNNVVVAARAALARDDVERVLIVDWDVHHGNGTQALVERDPAIRFVSLHQWPLYPGTGRAGERGVGNVWNVPRPPGLAPGSYVRDLLAAVGEATSGWRPQLILISAGFDAMRGDPLAGFTLEAGHYLELSQRLREFGVPLVAMLEGGYDLANLRAGVRTTVEAFG